MEPPHHVFLVRPSSTDHGDKRVGTAPASRPMEHPRSAERSDDDDGYQGPPSGEVRWVPSRALKFGRYSKVQKDFRPVLALGRRRGPFCITQPITSHPRTLQTNHQLFLLWERDYDASTRQGGVLGLNDSWPKAVFRRPENVPFGRIGARLGRVRPTTMQQIEKWLCPPERARGPTHGQAPGQSPQS